MSVAPGVYPHMTDAEYFAIDAVSHSDLKLILDSPAKYRYRKDNPGSHKPTSDMVRGSAVHSLVLGGPRVVQVPFDDWRKNEAKALRDEVLAEGGFPLLTDDFCGARRCAAAVSNHRYAKMLLDSADHMEVVLVWIDEHGTLRKAKVDLVAGRFIVDLKTTGDASTEAFGRSAAKFGYVTQGVSYCDGARACLGIDDPKFLIVAIEKDAPYLVNVLDFDDYTLELAARRVDAALASFRQCVEADDWPGYGDGINRCELPRWAEIEMEAA